MESITSYWEETPFVPIRPLGEISDFVIETLPVLINALAAEQNPEIKQGHALELAKSIEYLFSRISPVRLEEIKNSSSLKVALLDCKMCAMALWHSGIYDLPKSFSYILQTLSDTYGYPIILTYEDIVLNNPIADMRTFFGSTDVVGKNEYLFYRSHQVIEDELSPVIELLRRTVDSAEIKTAEINDLWGRMKKCRIILKKLLIDELQSGPFNKFRNYLDSTKFHSGPSGAFTGSYPLIDLFWRGPDHIPIDNREKYIEQSNYFPVHQREEIRELILNPKRNIRSLGRIKGPEFEILFRVLKIEMVNFRSLHLKAVEKHLPDVYSGKAKGTGGTLIDYLKKALENTRQVEL